MKWRRLISMIKAQSGAALAELMVGIAITGAIGGVMVMTIIQTDTVGTSNTNRIVSVNYVQNAGYWIQVDTKMAQTIELDAGDSGLPVVLNWVDWDSTEHQVSYSVSGDKLQRIHLINSGSPHVIFVAQSVDTEPNLTNCEFVDGVLNFTLTTAEGSGKRGNTETRMFSFKPRVELVVLKGGGEEA